MFNKKPVYSIIAISILYCGLASCGFNASDSSVVLTWDVPATNTDGTPLTDVAGYDVYIGSSSRNYSRTINVAIGDKWLWCRGIDDNKSTLKSSGKCSYAVKGLRQGNYYFAVSAYNSSGARSAYSNEVIKTATPQTRD